MRTCVFAGLMSMILGVAPACGQTAFDPLADATPPQPSPLWTDASMVSESLPPVATADAASDSAAKDNGYFTLDELKRELRPLAWQRGDFKVVPYGFLQVTTIYDTTQTVSGEYTLYVESPDVAKGNALYIDPKTSRLGLDITGPNVTWLGDAQIGGKAEIDFQGNYVFRNQGGIQFRQGYVEAKNDDYRLLVGQAWEVLSPMYPNMLIYVPAAGAGNLGYRRVQARAERFLDCGDSCLVTLQGSANADIVWDFNQDRTVLTDHAGWPVMEGRVALTLGERKGPQARPVTLGVSGHIGEQMFSFPYETPRVMNLARRTWSICPELRIPLTERMGVAAEYFNGENLSAFMGGVFQGVDRLTHNTIRSQGGWVDVWYDWRKDLHSHVGYSIDDPFDQDLHVATERAYNHIIFANTVYDITKLFTVGLEVSTWKTLYQAESPGDLVHLEIQIRYGF